MAGCKVESSWKGEGKDPDRSCWSTVSEAKKVQVSARMEIRMLLEDYESRNIRLQEVMGLIEGLVNQIPMAEKLLEIKGVGIKTVSGFLAECRRHQTL